MARQGSYKRDDGIWQVRATFPDGSRRAFYASTEREAIKKKNRALEEHNAGLSRGGENLTVPAFVKLWLEERGADAEGIRPSTLTAYTSHYTTHIKPAMKGIRLRDLEPADVDRMLRRIVEGGASPTTANRVRATLRAALSWGISQRWISFNAAAQSRARTENRERVKPLTVPQAQKLIEGTKDTSIGTLIVAAIFTGLRQGELLGLEWQHIDFENETLSVKQTLTWTKNPDATGPRNLPGFTPPKTDSSKRTIHIPEPALEALETQKQRVIELEQLATVARWKPIPGRDLVFPSSTGGPLNSSNVTNGLRKALKALELPHQRFHDLRHLTASLLLAEGEDIFTVKEILGHSQITLTADTYGHLTEKLSKSAALKLSGALSSGVVEVTMPNLMPDTIAPDDTGASGEGDKS